MYFSPSTFIHTHTHTHEQMVIVGLYKESLVYRDKYIEKSARVTYWLATGLFRGTAQTVTARRTQARSALRPSRC